MCVSCIRACVCSVVDVSGLRVSITRFSAKAPTPPNTKIINRMNKVLLLLSSTVCTAAAEVGLLVGFAVAGGGVRFLVAVDACWWRWAGVCGSKLSLVL